MRFAERLTVVARKDDGAALEQAIGFEQVEQQPDPTIDFLDRLPIADPARGPVVDVHEVGVEEEAIAFASRERLLDRGDHGRSRPIRRALLPRLPAQSPAFAVPPGIGNLEPLIEALREARRPEEHRVRGDTDRLVTEVAHRPAEPRHLLGEAGTRRRRAKARHAAPILLVPGDHPSGVAG